MALQPQYEHGHECHMQQDTNTTPSPEPCYTNKRRALRVHAKEKEYFRIETGMTFLEINNRIVKEVGNESSVTVLSFVNNISFAFTV